MNRSTPKSFSAHLCTHLPLPNFDHRDLDHPFYQALVGYLTQMTKGALLYNDLRPSFTRIIKPTFSWMPHLSVIGAWIQVERLKDTETLHQHLNVYQHHTHLLSPLALLQPSTSAQTTVVGEADEKGTPCDTPMTDPQYEVIPFGCPGLCVVAGAVTFCGGKTVKGQVGSLVAEVQHFMLDSRTTVARQATSIAKAKSLDALAQTITFLATTWIQAGTWKGVAMSNSKFSRACVLEGVSESKVSRASWNGD